MKQHWKTAALIILIYICTSVSSKNVHHLQPGSRVDFIPNRGFADNFQIFCYEGRPKYLIHIWQTILLNLDINTNNFYQYGGSTPEDVEKEYQNQHSIWSWNIFSLKSKLTKLDPFSSSCLGIDASVKYTVSLQLIRIDYWKVLYLLGGIFLYLSAPKLSNNSLFYYICGIVFGICASFLILIYFLSRMFPKKPVMYGFVVGGWAVAVYFFQLLWENIRTIAVNYQTYVIYYILGSGLISFIICYRMGPPTNPRSKNIIKWSLMATGLVLIFNSSQFQEAAMGIIIILLICYNMPQSWISKTKTFWKQRFPPKRRLLNNDEYYQEGVKETCKALDELRTYCSSPECNQWRTVLKLKNVKRFASFMEGSSHISDEEVVQYEDDLASRSMIETDDESITEDSSSSIDI